MLLSARTESALERMARNLATYVQEEEREQGEVKLADVAYSLQVGRQRFAHRRMLLCQRSEEMGAIVQSRVAGCVWSRQEEQQERGVVFVLPGIGEEVERVAGERLYEQEETFKYWVDYCCQFLQPILG